MEQYRRAQHARQAQQMQYQMQAAAGWGGQAMAPPRVMPQYNQQYNVFAPRPNGAVGPSQVQYSLNGQQQAYGQPQVTAAAPAVAYQLQQQQLQQAAM